MENKPYKLYDNSGRITFNVIAIVSLGAVLIDRVSRLLRDLNIPRER